MACPLIYLYGSTIFDCSDSRAAAPGVWEHIVLYCTRFEHNLICHAEELYGSGARGDETAGDRRQRDKRIGSGETVFPFFVPHMAASCAIILNIYMDLP
jgi:hypothetical protein